MKKFLFVAALAVASAMTSASADAAVTYRFDDPSLGGFTLTTSDFATDWLTAQDATLSDCNADAGGGTCSDATLWPGFSSSLGSHDRVDFRIRRVECGGSCSSTTSHGVIFEAGAFAKEGTYKGSFSNAVLTVSRVAAVPEPATWAMMMLGFGIVGYSLRRKTALRFV